MAWHGVLPTTAVLVQCTSPFIDPGDLDRAVDLIAGDQADSAFAAVDVEFLWRAVPVPGGSIGAEP